ncbi:hypothetical protein GCM10010980_21670 [Corynebacterium marinum]|nr:hypothetical protein GCM10010980_21670 [Corynebacterium marinum]
MQKPPKDCPSTSQRPAEVLGVVDDVLGAQEGEVGGVEKQWVGEAVDPGGAPRAALVEQEDAVIAQRLGEPTVEGGRARGGMPRAALEEEQRRERIVRREFADEHLEALPRVRAVPGDGEGVVPDGDAVDGARGGGQHCDHLNG